MNGKAPALDPAIASRTGVTRDGRPVSYNRLPAPDLLPWIAWFYYASVRAPEDHLLDCSLFNDISVIRIQLQGDWTAQTRDGTLRHTRAALHFGPHSKAMPVAVRGSFVSIGMALRPGTGTRFTGGSTVDYVDRITDCSDLGLPAEAALAALDGEASPEEILQRLEALIRHVIAANAMAPPEPETALFETLALTSPTTPVGEFADSIGIDIRRLERIVRRDFGLPPKQVLRRARALDMASQMLGVGDAEEAEEIALRFYDQSHLIREFIALFGVSPKHFIRQPRPLLTSALESRQARRLAEINRLGPNEKRPWE